MAKGDWVQVGKRKLQLSNLEKVLYPVQQIVKAEVVQYYLQMAPLVLHHLRGRPLTLIRYPDGIDQEAFYQKNRPDWAPEWVEYARIGGERTKEYIIARETAVLIWLANLACLEIHQMHARVSPFTNPDYFVFDLDPPENYPFDQLIELAFDLRIYLQEFGYKVYVKTSGGKGLHLFIPLQADYSYSECFEAFKLLAQAFVRKHLKTSTLHLKKEARKGRVLLDIYRNRPSQSIVSAYSLRGNPGAPVSTPLTWEELERTKDPVEWNINSVRERININPDPWESMGAYSAPLHTHSSTVQGVDLPQNAHRKTPDQLTEYAKKRNFSRTPEPGGGTAPGGSFRFVIHRHHARRLHYDLRLEQDGILKSWALPKGLPPRPGEKRMAVSTEDHPLDYLEFEGIIPKGEYGGGAMWIFALGKYQVTRRKKNGFYFLLASEEVSGEYRMHQSKEKEWILERVGEPHSDWLSSPPRVMTAINRADPPVDDDYQFEIKWDGIRALFIIQNGELRILSRNQQDLTSKFPEFQPVEEHLRCYNGIFDGEIICFDHEGKPDFKKVIHRMQRSGEERIRQAQAKYPAYAYLFDLMYLDGRSVTNEPLERRREWLEDCIIQKTAYRFSEALVEGEAMFEASRSLGLEGIMAKHKGSRYLPGQRSDLWLKIKVRQTADCYVIGFTEGKSDRHQTFGALHLAEQKGDGWKYRGKVGTGFTSKQLYQIRDILDRIPKSDRYISEKPLDWRQSTWIAPKLIVEVRYASLTPDENFREPVFVRVREDKMKA